MKLISARCSMAPRSLSTKKRAPASVRPSLKVEDAEALGQVPVR